jgi:hypothetical protein
MPDGRLWHLPNDQDPAMNDAAPLDADELMNFAERIEQLPPMDAEWVNRLFQECLRARMHEAELMCAATEEGDVDGKRGEIETQLAQVALDAAEWLKTLWNVGYMGAGSFPAQPRSTFPLIELEDVLKSALFARIREGKRPFPPPTRDGLPWHDLIEGAERSHDVTAEILRDEKNAPVRAVIEGCTGWHVVEALAGGEEYLVQHLGKGPVFTLSMATDPARLKRLPPRWQRPIRRQERGGYCSYLLEWLKDDGQLQAVPLRAATWERAESEAAHWIANTHPQMYGQVSFERMDD